MAMKLGSASLAALLLAGLGATAQAAPNLVQNGSFESSSYTSSNQFGTGYGGQGVTDWAGNGGFNIYYFGSTAFSTAPGDQPNTQYTSPSQPQNLWGGPHPSPDGGNFVGLDGEQTPGVQGAISQTINGLIVGQTYTLNFDWAAGQIQSRTGPTTEQLQASLGGQSFTTSVVDNPNQGFTGWFTDSFTYTATATSEVLSFLSIGTPTGLPPIALLDGVSLTQNVPEPSTLALMLTGIGAVGFLVRRRRSSMGAA